MTLPTSEELSRPQREHIARLAALPGGTATVREGARTAGRQWSRACLNKLRGLGIITLKRGGAPVASLTPEGWRVAARLASAGVAERGPTVEAVADV